MKNYKTPGCQYNPEGIQCDPNGRHCESCGHNPAVAAARTEKAFPGYLAALRHLPPVDRERLLVGNWGIRPATIEG